jgi:Putative lumazine-binding
MTNYVTEYDAITKIMQRYIEGGRAGKSELMRPSFHSDATIVGYCGGTLLTGPIQQLFGWIDGNCPAPGIEPASPASRFWKPSPLFVSKSSTGRGNSLAPTLICPTYSHY